VCDQNNYRVQYFTAGGSFLGKWGSEGKGNAQFNFPVDVTFGSGGNRVYVVDDDNDRIQYFKWDDRAVAPTSLGRVKAMFK
jgi:DNA-binding beta-propeller fold protein YncE